MRRISWATAALAVAAAGAAVLAATPASAHGAPFTVTAGSAPVGTSVPVTLTTTPSGTPGQFLWRDTSTHVLLSCASVTLKGAVTTGSTGARVGTIDGSRSVFTNCTGPAGLKFAITGFGTWTLDVADAANGASAIRIGNFRAHVQTTAGPNCGGDFAAPTGTFTSSGTATTDPGSLSGSYDNNARTLAVPAADPGTLGFWNVRGGTSGTLTYCISTSYYKQGDRMSWSATWNVLADTAAYNPVAIN